MALRPSTARESFNDFNSSSAAKLYILERVLDKKLAAKRATIDPPRARQLISYIRCRVNLLQNNHLACRGERSRTKMVEVNAASDVLAEVIAPIPIDGFGLALIQRCRCES